MKFVWTCLFATLVCCGSHRAQDDDKMPECEAYAAKLRACFGANSRPAAIAQTHTPDKIPPELRARTREACSRDLERLSRACR
jgi:hypothetical protein